MILSYSSKRAKKDKRTREKALQKIKATLSKKNITKSDLKLSYYAKYLDIDDKCSIKYKLNPDKVMQDERLDGIKGFITNDFTLSANDIIAHYQNQYDVERAFRISKTDLRIRPIYHRLENRIKAHILISFVSYAIYKEFERRLKMHNIKFKFSHKLLRKIIEHITALKIDDELLPINPSPIQKEILKIFEKWKCVPYRGRWEDSASEHAAKAKKAADDAIAAREAASGDSGGSGGGSGWYVSDGP